MKILNVSERMILQLLLHSSNLKLGTFTIFKKLKIDMPSLIKIFSDLERYGYIRYTSKEVELLDEGKEYIYVFKQKVSTSEKAWEKIPERFVCKELYVNEFYVPSKKLLSKKNFRKSGQ